MTLWWAALAAGAFAQDLTFSPEAQVRPRWEADTGRDGIPGEGGVSYVSWRARLGATLSRGDVAARLVVQDVRVFGTEADTRRDFDATGLDLRIGYLQWDPGYWTFQVGRLEQGLHRERLIAIANWRQPGRVFDGARVHWGREIWEVEARAYILREGDVVDLSVADQGAPGVDDQFLVLLTGGRRASRGFFEPVVVFDADLEAGTTRATFGAVTTLRDGAWGLDLEGYGQLGEVANTPVRAGMVGVAGTFAPDAAWKPAVTLWLDVLTGDGKPNDGTGTAFATLYGANHKYYGHVDMVSFVVGGPKDAQGLIDPALKLRASPTEGLGLALDTHAFLAAAPIDGALLAIEPDAQVTVKLAPGLTLQGGVNAWIAPDADDRELMGYTVLDARL